MLVVSGPASVIYTNAVPMSCKERLRRLAGVVRGTILNDDEILCGFRQYFQEKGLVGFGVEALSDGLVEQATGKEVKMSKSFSEGLYTGRA